MTEPEPNKEPFKPRVVLYDPNAEIDRLFAALNELSVIMPKEGGFGPLYIPLKIEDSEINDFEEE